MTQTFLDRAITLEGGIWRGATRYIVMTSSAHVSGKARQFGRYRNVPVVEVYGDARPAMISERQKCVRRIVKHWGACHAGKTPRCEFLRALAEAEALCAELNKESAL